MQFVKMLGFATNIRKRAITAVSVTPPVTPELQMTKTLTVAAVEKLKADPTKRIEISDGFVPALRVVVSPTGNKSFAVRFKHYGRPKKLTIGSVDKFSLTQARDLARAALCEVAKGNDPTAQKKAARARAKVAARTDEDLVETVVEDFIRRHVVNLKSAPDVMRLLRKELRPWRGQQIQDITKREVLKLVDDVHDRGSPTTARRLLANLKKFFSWLIERDILFASPCVSVKPPSEGSIAIGYSRTKNSGGFS